MFVGSKPGCVNYDAGHDYVLRACLELKSILTTFVVEIAIIEQHIPSVDSDWLPVVLISNGKHSKILGKAG